MFVYIFLFSNYCRIYPNFNIISMSLFHIQLSLEIVFEEARSGMMQVTLFEAKGLRNIDPMGQQDPYVQLCLGRHYKKRSKSVKNGGSSPYFEEEEILLWLDQENWVDNLKVQLLDEDAKEDKPIGETEFSLLPYMKQRPEEAQEDTYDLFYKIQIDPKDDTEKKEVACGEVIMRVSKTRTFNGCYCFCTDICWALYIHLF